MVLTSSSGDSAEEASRAVDCGVSDDRGVVTVDIEERDEEDDQVSALLVLQQRYGKIPKRVHTLRLSLVGSKRFRLIGMTFCYSGVNR